MTHGWAAFTRLWFAQFCAATVVQLLLVALGIHLHAQAASATPYTTLTAIWAISWGVGAPLTGWLLDRVAPLRLFFWAIAGSGAVATAGIARIAFASPSFVELAALMMLGGIGSASVNPAIITLAPRFLPHDKLTSGNALITFGLTGCEVLGLIGAGALWATGKALAVGVIIAALSLAGCAMAFPEAWSRRARELRASPDAHRPPRDARPMGSELFEGLRHLLRTPLMRVLLFTQIVCSATARAFEVLLLSLVLGFGTPETLSAVTLVGFAGLAFGASLLLRKGSAFDSPRAIQAAPIILGASILVASLRADAAWIAAGAFGAWASVPLLGGPAQTVWHRSVPSHLHGRVFGLKAVLGTALVPVAAFACGPLVDRVFTPWLSAHGADPVGTLFGTGPGRGAALFLSLCAGLLLLLGVVLTRSPHLSNFLPARHSTRGHERTADAP